MIISNRILDSRSFRLCLHGNYRSPVWFCGERDLEKEKREIRKIVKAKKKKKNSQKT